MIFSRTPSRGHSRLASLLFFWSVVFPVLDAVPAYAEFLLTGANTFQDSNLTVTAVRAPEGGDFPGVMFVRHKETQLQLFDLEKLNEDQSTTSLFVEYDPDSKQYVAIHLGKKKFTVRGGFRLLLGKDSSVVLSLSGKDSRFPWMTLYVKGKTPQSSALLGFAGVTHLFNLSGEGVHFFQARTHDDTKGILQDYTVLPAHQLMLGGELVTAKHVGITLRSAQPCLQRGAFLLDPEGSERAKKLSEADLPVLEYDNQYSRLEEGSLLALLPRDEKARFLNASDGAIYAVTRSRMLQSKGRSKAVCETKLETRVELQSPVSPG